MYLVFINNYRKKEIFNSLDQFLLINSNLNLLLQVLYAHMSFQLFVDTENTKEVIEELNSCHKNAKVKKKTKKKNEENEEPYWVEVVVDLLLSLLARANHTLRNIIQIVIRLEF